MGSERETPFGKRLRRLREAAGLSRDELASRSGLSTKAIGALERGERRRPHPHTFGALADALGLSEEERAALFATIPGRSVPTVGVTAGDAASPLPISPTSLVGRSREVGAARELLLGEDTRLVTLVGAGGVGKTRLALEIAGEAAVDFPDGVVFVALAPIEDPGLVVTEVSAALGLREAPGRSARDALFARLREKRLLLVLDNFEHLTEAATEVAALLAACPGPRVLVTSREVLGVRGERRFPVPPLGVPDLSRFPAPEEVAASEAARLFVERAREVSPGFEVTRKNAAAVAAICRRLDGLPLALELAAALVRALPPREILGRLDEALPLLVGGPRDLPERQRTMRSTLAWSHDLLDEAERIAFRRLSVFSGGFKLAAAEAVLELERNSPEGSTVLEIVPALLDKSLLVADAADDEPRFGMLETIRAYGLERLGESGEERSVRARHGRFYLGLAEEAELHLNGPDRDAWMGDLEVEHDNLRAALSWSISEGQAEVALRLAGALFWFWFHAGHWSEGRAWLERTLGLASEGAARGVATAARAKTLRCAGALTCLQGDFAVASALLEESVALWRPLGEGEELAYALLFLDSASLGLGEVGKARAAIEESVALFREADDAFGLAASLASLGVVLRALEDRAAARSALEESAGIARRLGDDFLLSLPMLNLGGVALEQGDHDRAEVYLKESLILLGGQPGEEWFVAQSLDMLATIASGREDHTRAACLYGAAEALREAAGSTVQPYYAAGRERGVAAVRKALGEGFAAAWAEGRDMTPGQMIAEAVGGGPPQNRG